MSFIWHDPGRLRIPSGKGRARKWRQVYSIEQYPLLTDDLLVALAYPAGDKDISPSGMRTRRERARSTLGYLISIGFCQITEAGTIMPGSTWAGWGEKKPGLTG